MKSHLKSTKNGGFLLPDFPWFSLSTTIHLVVLPVSETSKSICFGSCFPFLRFAAAELGKELEWWRSNSGRAKCWATRKKGHGRPWRRRHDFVKPVMVKVRFQYGIDCMCVWLWLIVNIVYVCVFCKSVFSFLMFFVDHCERGQCEIVLLAGSLGMVPAVALFLPVAGWLYGCIYIYMDMYVYIYIWIMMIM